MKIADELIKYRGMKAVELKKELTDLSSEATKAILQVKAGKSNDVAAVRKLRRSYARVLTILNEKNRMDDKDE